MRTQTLGERLKARLERDEEDKLQKLERETREKDAEAQRQLADVKEFFLRAQKAIIEDIEADRPVRRIVLGQGQNLRAYQALTVYNWNDPHRRVDDPHHQYYPLWEQFANWAQDNGLAVDWRYEWDGGGMESWHVLTVKPL